MLVNKYRNFWLPILALPAITIFVVCFGKIFHAMTTRMVERANEPTDYRRRFLTISILHLVGFIVCAAPATVLIILDVIIQIDPDRLETLRRVFVIVLSGNPLVDSIGFLIVYRGKLRNEDQREISS